MKILAIGDFHGKFPGKLKKRIKKENVDLILSPGDFCGNEKLSKLFFKHAYGTNKQIFEFIGKAKVKRLDKDNYNSGIKILNELNNLGKKVIAVKGNWDPTNWKDIGHSNIKDPYTKKFDSFVSKLENVKIIDFNNQKSFGFNFVGYPRSTYPGKITKHIEEKIKKRDGKKAKETIKRVKEDNRKFFELFKKKFKEGTIFISHNCPYNTKLDKIKKGPQKGKHYGSYLARKIIKELKPVFTVCGHIHEGCGKCKIGKTIVVNPGAAVEGKAAIIEFDEVRRKVEKVRFLR